MEHWAEAINRGEPVVVEQSPIKVRLILWGLGVPAVGLTLVAVVAPEDLWVRVFFGGLALILWRVLWVFRRNTTGPKHGRLVAGREGLELPRRGGVLIPWTDIARAGFARGIPALWLTPEGFQRYYAHLPGWLRPLALINMRGLSVPRTFEAGAEEVLGLIDNQHQRYGAQSR